MSSGPRGGMVTPSGPESHANTKQRSAPTGERAGHVSPPKNSRVK